MPDNRIISAACILQLMTSDVIAVEKNFHYKNVVVIVGDDHSTKTVGCYGNRMIHTPNLDRMAANGVIFTNAYSSSPVSSPSRQSLLTSKYPHATGVSLLTSSFEDDGNETIAEHLKKFGYSTALIGKTHFNTGVDRPPSHGFDLYCDSPAFRDYQLTNKPTPVPDSIISRKSWAPFVVPAREWLNADMIPESCYDKDAFDTFLANSAANYIQAKKSDKFFLWLAFHVPHSPFNFPVEYRGKYNPADIIVPGGSPEDDRWIPAIFRDLTYKDKQGIAASCYTSVEFMDKNIGIVLDELKKLGIEDETLVIYLGDQGYLLGEHKRFEKHTMWSESIKAPLIIQTGSHLKRGIKIDQLTQFIDVVPSILDLLGLPPMKEAMGKSFLPVLKGEKSEYNDYVFSEFLEDNKAMVATKDWKYIFTSGKRDLGQGYATGFPPPGILHRLYDLKNDPGETTNVADKPENKDILIKMQKQMIKTFLQTHPKAKEIKQYMSTDERLTFFCEPYDRNARLVSSE